MNQTPGGTACGAVAILSWGALGALGAMSAGMPPYLVLGLCFTVAAALGGVICAVRGLRPAPLLARETLIAAALLSVYHLCYLEAFHHAASIPVSLINYLWPACLIVIGNLLFRLESGWAGYIGAATGFAGVAILIAGDGLALKAQDVTGYGFAFVGALVWATYSNIRRRARLNGMGAMVSICVLSAILCLSIAVLAGESFDLTKRDVAVVLLLGLGPAGGAFFLWDIGMRRGDAALLGVMGYSAPVLSTLLMITLGMGTFSWTLAAAVLLITLGGIIVQTGGTLSTHLARWFRATAM